MLMLKNLIHNYSKACTAYHIKKINSNFETSVRQAFVWVKLDWVS